MKKMFETHFLSTIIYTEEVKIVVKIGTWEYIFQNISSECRRIIFLTINYLANLRIKLRSKFFFFNNIKIQ